MFNKITVPLVLALLAALAIGGVAYAASHSGEAPGPAAQAAGEVGKTFPIRRGLGEITALGDDQFTLKLRNGEEKVIRVDENTHYLKADGSAGSFADLQVGQWVIGRADISAEEPLARVVVLLPEGFDPDLIRHAGKITTADPAANSFTIKTRRGENLTFQVDSSTQYLGQVGSLAVLQPGMAALVGSKLLEDGSYLAVRVTAHEKPHSDVKKAGRVSAIDTDAFTLRTRDGQTYTFQVTPETRFRSPGGRVRGLKDLRLGMGLVVAAQESEAGQLQAVLVIARAR